PAAEVSETFEPHSVLRKSFHFIPWSVPACCAALYLAPHSFIVSACADGSPLSTAAPTRVMMQIKAQRLFMDFLPFLDMGSSPAGHIGLIGHTAMWSEPVDDIGVNAR